jgi:hypothetical protein
MQYQHQILLCTTGYLQMGEQDSVGESVPMQTYLMKKRLVIIGWDEKNEVVSH